MMLWYGGGFGLFWLWPLMWVLFWGVLIALFVWRGRRPWGGWHRGPSAASVLGERYARGEIDEREYRERLEVLKQHER